MALKFYAVPRLQGESEKCSATAKFNTRPLLESGWKKETHKWFPLETGLRMCGELGCEQGSCSSKWKLSRLQEKGFFWVRTGKEEEAVYIELCSFGGQRPRSALCAAWSVCIRCDRPKSTRCRHSNQVGRTWSARMLPVRTSRFV